VLAGFVIRAARTLEVVEDRLVLVSERTTTARAPRVPPSGSNPVRVLRCFASVLLEYVSAARHYGTRRDRLPDEYSSFGSSMPPFRSRQLRTRTPIRSVMQAKRADAARAHFAGARRACVCDASSLQAVTSGRGLAQCAWNSSGPIEKRPGSPPTSFKPRRGGFAVERGVLDARHTGRVVCGQRTTNSSVSRERRLRGGDAPRIHRQTWTRWRRRLRDACHRSSSTCCRRAATRRPPRGRRAGRALAGARTPRERPCVRSRACLGRESPRRRFAALRSARVEAR